MKPTIAITTTILVCGLAAGLASAQSPSIVQNVRTTMNGVSDNATAASNEALGVRQSAPAAPAAHAPSKSSAPAQISVTQKSIKPAAAKGVAPPKVVVRRRAHLNAGVAPAVAAAPVAAPETAPEASAPAEANAGGAGEGAAGEPRSAPDSKYNANGRRDPFISPVVSRTTGGSGCSTGKKCLDIGTINLRGVVHYESGFIAVVSNGLNKAYFLRENDPVFNGYVMRITGDSIVFQETLQDRLGKSFTREVVKKISTPAV